MQHHPACCSKLIPVYIAPEPAILQPHGHQADSITSSRCMSLIWCSLRSTASSCLRSRVTSLDQPSASCTRRSSSCLQASWDCRQAIEDSFSRLLQVLFLSSLQNSRLCSIMDKSSPFSGPCVQPTHSSHSVRLAMVPKGSQAACIVPYRQFRLVRQRKARPVKRAATTSRHQIS